MANDKEQIAHLKGIIKKLEKENKQLKKILGAVKAYVEGDAQAAQQRLLAGGLPAGEYHRYEGNLESDNAIAAIIGAEQTSVIKKRRRLLGWGL